MDVLRALAGLVGAALVLAVLLSAIETVLLPRRGFTRIARFVFAAWHRVLVRRTLSPKRGEQQRALLAPLALITLPLVWMIGVILAFSLIFWAGGGGAYERAVIISGSSVTTLGFAAPNGDGLSWVCFIEAIIGLGLVALLISYLPAINASYNQREKAVVLVNHLAGRPPSCVKLLTTMHSRGDLGQSSVWTTVMNWFTDLEQSHTAFPALCYFPAQSPGDSWLAALGSVLDAAALATGRSERPRGEGPALVLAHGSQCLVRIAIACGLPISPSGAAIDSSGVVADDGEISLQRAEYETLLDQLEATSVLEPGDRDQAWESFLAARRVYDKALRGLAGLCRAAPSPMTTDRPARVGRPRLIGTRPLSADWRLPFGSSSAPGGATRTA